VAKGPKYTTALSHERTRGGRTVEGPDQTLSEMRRARKSERHRIGIAPQHLHVCGTLHVLVVTQTAQPAIHA
jgi:hypothetical protein